MQARTQFPPQARSAAQARHWVRDHLNQIGRGDLVAAAEAGVSELVTNGILHAQTSIGLALTGSHERVVIEVYDGSPMVHQRVADAAPTLDSTIGRGLRIVRAYAREWGVSTTTHGKAIWFQPIAGERVDGAEAPAEATNGAARNQETSLPPLDLDEALDALAEAFPEPAAEMGTTRAAAREPDEQTVQVSLLGVPPFVLQHHRKRWLELVREMQLVALAEPSRQQDMAGRFCDAARAVQADLYRIGRSADDASPPVSDDGGAVDALAEVAPSMRDAFVEIRDMARELEKNWTGIALLFIHPGEQARQLREWWLGELIGQIDGAEPTRWPGEMRVRDEATALRVDA
jgi:anti-sigma regulatory factor (Ser/Thr protein kinase)